MNLTQLYTIIDAQRLLENKGDEIFRLVDGIYQAETIKALSRTVSQVKPILEKELNKTLTNDEAQIIIKQILG
jgi:hypothetical protein